MLPKVNRFQFKSKLPKHTLNSKYFSIKYDKNSEGLKVAAVISKRVDRRAVVRNRIKRVILEAVRVTLDKNLPITAIFYVKKEAVGAKDLANEVVNELKNIKWTD